MRWRAGLFLVLALAATLSSASWVAADDALEARFFDARARHAFERGRYRTALEAFLASHAAAPSDATLYNAGVSAYLAGIDPLAHAMLTEYLAGADEDAERREDARSRVADLERELALVEVTSEPPGASIAVDREALGEHGRTPRVIALSPGAHTLTAHLEGHAPATVEVRAVEGARSVAALRLTPRVGGLELAAEPDVVLELIAPSGERLPAAAGTRLELPVGRYEVLARRPDGPGVRETVLVVEGETTRVAPALAPAPPPTGRLLVGAGERTGTVFLDGAAVGELPVVIERARTGSRRVEVRFDDGTTFATTTDVVEDRATLLEVPRAAP